MPKMVKNRAVPKKGINRDRALGGGWGGGGPNPPPLKCCTSYHNLHHSKSRFAWSDSTILRKFVVKNQLKKMQARGKTCFLQQQEILLNQKSEEVPQKKPTVKIDVLKNQLKKCKLEVRHAFCNTEKTLLTQK